MRRITPALPHGYQRNISDVHRVKGGAKVKLNNIRVEFCFSYKQLIVCNFDLSSISPM